MVKSYAKINLTLDVLGKQANGYHELATIMQTVDLADTLCFTFTDDNQVTVVCSRPELSGANNLVARAAEALRQRCGIRQGVLIEHVKVIPVAAGLGGGSGNAATVLTVLRSLWKLPLTDADLLEIAAELGSDVPFFLRHGLALCEGRGERLTTLQGTLPDSMRWFLLLKPEVGVSTASVFRALPASDYTDGRHSRAVIDALAQGLALDPVHLHNGLERSVLEQYPEIAVAREQMLAAGSPLVRLSGSGSTLFAPFSQLSEAARVQQVLQSQGYTVYLTRAITPSFTE